MAGGRWQVAGGRWQVAGGRWQVAGGPGHENGVCSAIFLYQRALFLSPETI